MATSHSNLPHAQHIESYRYLQRFRVPFRDVDMFDHVNNVAYMTWCEDIRINYFQDVLQEPIKGGPLGMIILRMEWHYNRQVRYGDELALGARTSRFGKKSFDISYELWNETAKERAGWGLSVLVAFDYAANHSVAVPAAWRERVAAFEQVAPSEG